MNEVVRTPLVLDTSVLIAIARADADIIGLIQGYAVRNQPMVVPALACAGASLDARSDEADDLLAGLELLDSVTPAPLRGAEQAARLASMIARTELDAWDAHAAAIADVAICPILTLDASRWKRPNMVLEHPLNVIEIADPGQAERGE